MTDTDVDIEVEIEAAELPQCCIDALAALLIDMAERQDPVFQEGRD